MQPKLGLVALSVMATLVLFGGGTAEAKSNETDNKAPEPVYVKVQPGDNLTNIATTQNTSYIRLFNANEEITNPDLIFADQQLRIPTNEEQLPDRLAQFPTEQQAQIVAAAGYQQASAASAAPTTVARGSSSGNSYGWGWCTWYAKEKRPDLPNALGNGGQWVANAAAQGLRTGSAPAVGAIAEEPGHVAYVESVNGDGTITISEMGYNYTQGQYNRRTVPAANYRYIY